MNYPENIKKLIEEQGEDPDNTSIREALDIFLKNEGIIGYTEKIMAIIEPNTVPNYHFLTYDKYFIGAGSILVEGVGPARKFRSANIAKSCRKTGEKVISLKELLDA